MAQMTSWHTQGVSSHTAGNSFLNSAVLQPCQRAPRPWPGRSGVPGQELVQAQQLHQLRHVKVRQRPQKRHRHSPAPRQWPCCALPDPARRTQDTKRAPARQTGPCGGQPPGTSSAPRTGPWCPGCDTRSAHGVPRRGTRAGSAPVARVQDLLKPSLVGDVVQDGYTHATHTAV
jgi:hypothetical protein